MIDPTAAPPATLLPPVPTDRDGALFAAAQDLEASFLAEMLRSAGLGEARDAFGGGAGESQFAGMLADEQARAMAEAGGIGLAEAIYRSLTRGTE